MASSPNDLVIGGDTSGAVQAVHRLNDEVLKFSNTLKALEKPTLDVGQYSEESIRQAANAWIQGNVRVNEFKSAIIDLSDRAMPTMVVQLQRVAGASETISVGFEKVDGVLKATNAALQQISLNADKASGSLRTVSVPKTIGGGTTTVTEQLKVDAAARKLETLLRQSELSYTSIRRLSETNVPVKLTTGDERVAIAAYNELIEAQRNLGQAHRDLVAKVQADNEQMAASERDLRRTRLEAFSAWREQVAEEARVRLANLTSNRTTYGINKVFGSANIPSNATFGEQAAYRSAVANLANLANQHGLTAAQVNKIWQRSNEGQIASRNTTTNEIIASINKIKIAEQNLGKAHTVVQKDQQKEIHETNRRMGQLIVSWQTVTRILLVHAGYRGLAILNQYLREAVTDARELLISISEIQTIDPDGNSSWSQWYDTLERISNKFGTDLADTAEAAYESLSNQVVDTREQFELFSAAVAKFSLATKSTVADSVNLLTATINAYGFSVAEAERISAIWFKTIDLGRIRANEFANTIGRILPLASQLGISLEEVASSLAVLTIRGVKANEAQTYLRNVLLKLLGPTEEMKDFYQELGVANGEVAVATYGWGGILERITEKTKGFSSELVGLVSRIRAVQGLVGLTGSNLEAYQEAVEQITTAQNEYNRAVELTTGNLGKKFQIELQQITNYFTREFGVTIIKTFDRVLGGIDNFDKAVKTLVNTLIELSKILAIGFTLRLAGITTGLRAYIATLVATGEAAKVAAVNMQVFWSSLLGGIAVTAVIGGIYAIVRAVEYASDRYTRFFDRLREQRDKAFEEINAAYEESVNKIAEAREQQISDVTQTIQYGLRFIAEWNKQLKQERDKFVDGNKLAIKNFTGFLSDLLSSVKKNLSEVTQDFEKVKNLIESIDDKLRERRRAGSDKIFDLQLDLLKNNPFAQAEQIRRRISQIIQESQQLIADPSKVTDKTLKDLEANEQRVSSLYDKLLGIAQSAPDAQGQLVNIINQVREANDYFETAYKRLQDIYKGQQAALAGNQKAAQDLVDKVEGYKNAIEDSKLNLEDLVNLDPDEINRKVDESIKRIRDVLNDQTVAPLITDPVRKAFEDQIKLAEEYRNQALRGAKGKQISEDIVTQQRAYEDLVQKQAEQLTLQAQLEAIEKRRGEYIKELGQTGAESVQYFRKYFIELQESSNVEYQRIGYMGAEALQRYSDILDKMIKEGRATAEEIEFVIKVLKEGQAALTGKQEYIDSSKPGISGKLAKEFNDLLNNQGAVYEKNTEDLKELVDYLQGSQKEYDTLSRTINALVAKYGDFNTEIEKTYNLIQNTIGEAAKLGLSNTIIPTVMSNLTQALINLNNTINTRFFPGFGVPNTTVAPTSQPAVGPVTININGAGQNAEQIAFAVNRVIRQGRAPLA